MHGVPTGRALPRRISEGEGQRACSGHELPLCNARLLRSWGVYKPEEVRGSLLADVREYAGLNCFVVHTLSTQLQLFVLH
jgi:hypothetical protein